MDADLAVGTASRLVGAYPLRVGRLLIDSEGGMVRVESEPDQDGSQDRSNQCHVGTPDRRMGP